MKKIILISIIILSLSIGIYIGYTIPKADIQIHYSIITRTNVVKLDTVANTDDPGMYLMVPNFKSSIKVDSNLTKFQFNKIIYESTPTK